MWQIHLPVGWSSKSSDFLIHYVSGQLCLFPDVCDIMSRNSVVKFYEEGVFPKLSPNASVFTYTRMQSCAVIKMN